MSIPEEVGKVAASTLDAMVNVGFLGFAAYVLGEVAANASERNKTQADLISNLVRDIRDCRQPAKPAWLELPLLNPAALTRAR
jgi:hypothetical protein